MLYLQVLDKNTKSWENQEILDTVDFSKLDCSEGKKYPARIINNGSVIAENEAAKIYNRAIAELEKKKKIKKKKLSLSEKYERQIAAQGVKFILTYIRGPATFEKHEFTSYASARNHLRLNPGQAVIYGYDKFNRSTMISNEVEPLS